MRALCIAGLCFSSLAAAQPYPSPDLLKLVQRQTDETYAELKGRAIAKGCVVPLPDKLVHANADRLNAAATLVNGKVQIIVSTGEETWLALAGNFGDRRSDVHWNKLFDAMGKLTNGEVSAPTKLSIWSDFEAERWGAWRAGFQTRMAFVLAHELGHACQNDLGTPDPADCDPQVLGIATCKTPKQCREARADKWAVDLLKANAKQLGVPSEGLLAGLMELALMDAASGRNVLEAPSEETHPVSFCRYSLLQKELDLRNVRDNYLSRIGSIIFCMEVSPASAQAALQAMGQSAGALCVTSDFSNPIAVGYGTSNQTLHVVKNSLGAALYGDVQSFLDAVEPERKLDRKLLPKPTKIFVGEKEFKVGALTDSDQRAWLKIIKAQPTLVLPNGFKNELDNL